MLERALKSLVRICTILGALALAIMMLSTCWDIFARTTMNEPLHGVVEIVEIMVLATAMLGLPETFLRDEQIKVDLLDNVFGAGVATVLKAFGLILSILFLGILTINVYGPMMDARLFGDIKPDLGLPVYPLYALIIFTFAASILSCGATLARLFTVKGAP